MMTLNVHRTLPPAAAPFPDRTLLSGLRAVVRGKDAIEAFQSSVCRAYGQRYCIPVSSGAAALTLILSALSRENPSRRRVMVPAYTCYSVPAAIKRAGLQIHPIDIDPLSLDFDNHLLSSAIDLHSNDTLAIMPTHLFGIPSDVNHWRSLLNDENIVVIEDAAQAMGAHGPHGLLGGIGDVGFLSLGRGKAFSTMGGGVIITNDTSLADSLHGEMMQCEAPGALHLIQLMMVTLFVHIFSRPQLFWLPKSLPFLRLGETIYDPEFGVEAYSAFQAGLAEGWRQRLESLRIQRRNNAEQWMQLTQDLGIETPAIQSQYLPNLIRFPIYVPQPSNQNELLLKSRTKGLGIMPGYPGAITRIPALRDELSPFKCDNARAVARQLVTLPTHGWVTAHDRKNIAEAVTSTLGRG